MNDPREVEVCLLAIMLTGQKRAATSKKKKKKRGAVVYRPGGWEDVQRGKPSYVFSVQIVNLIPSIVLPSTVYGCHGTFRRRSPLYAGAVRKKKEN